MCRAARAREATHLRWLNLETYRSLGLLKQLEERPYCWRHARQLAVPANEHLSVTFHVLAQAELDRLQRLAGLRGRHRIRAVERFGARARQGAGDGDQDTCLACVAGRQAAAVECQVILEELADDAGRDAYHRHHGLCREHLHMLLARAPRDVGDWLLEVTLARLASLKAELELYRGHDHGLEDGEQVAWRRALRYFWADVEVAAHEPPR
jgi:hypothetical protein